MEVKDMEFELLAPIGDLEEVTTLMYRSTIGYYKSIQFICVKWPKHQRTRVAKIGVCRNAAHTQDLGSDVYPDIERGRTWYWNLATKQLEDSKFGPPYKPYPASGEPDLEIPEMFWMVLDMDRGTLSFTLPENKRNLGVAFDDLNGNLLYVTYLEAFDEDETGKMPIEVLRRLGSK